MVSPFTSLPPLFFEGNEIMRLQAHSQPINDICLDSKGEYVASCSNDGNFIGFVANRLLGRNRYGVYCKSLLEGEIGA